MGSLKAEILSQGCSENKNQMGTIYYKNSDGEIVAKFCSKCGELKTLNDFSNNKAKFSGKEPKCKTCASKLGKKYHSQNIEKVHERTKRYRIENRENELERHRKYRKVNREKVNAYSLKWSRLNVDKKRLITLKRRARKAALPDTITKEQTREILSYFGEGCALTGDSNIHWDHVIPLATGNGGTILGNMIPLRSDLNHSKNDSNIFIWFENNRQRLNLEQDKFNSLIQWLAITNSMTIEQYRDYVYKCHGNTALDEAN
jgi:hypothetical protein